MSTLSQEANDVLRLAKAAATEFGLGYVGTEHLLLGLVREGKGLAAQTLHEHGVNEYNVLAAVQDQLNGALNQTWVLGRLPGTPHFCDVLTYAKAESRGAGNWQISSEHLLLGLLKTQKSTGYRVLCALGITPETVRKAIADTRLPNATPKPPADVQPVAVSQGRVGDRIGGLVRTPSVSKGSVSVSDKRPVAGAPGSVSRLHRPPPPSRTGQGQIRSDQVRS